MFQLFNVSNACILTAPQLSAFSTFELNLVQIQFAKILCDSLKIANRSCCEYDLLTLFLAPIAPTSLRLRRSIK